MMSQQPPLALATVPTDELKNLLHYLHQGEVTFPLDSSELARVGLQDRAEPLLQTLRGLDEAAVRAVLVAVLGERLEQAKPQA